MEEAQKMSEEDFSKYQSDYKPVKPAFPGLITTLNKMIALVENHVHQDNPDLKLTADEEEWLEDAKTAVREWSQYQLRGKDEEKSVADSRT